MASQRLLKLARASADRLRREIASCEISLHAGSAVFFLTLSVLPAAALLLGLFSILPHTVTVRLANVLSVFPEDTANLIRALLHVGDPVAVVSFSALTALWAASRGIFGIQHGLNRAFDLTETRSWLRTRAACMADTLLLLILIPFVLSLTGSLSRYLPMQLLRFLFLSASSYLVFWSLPDHKPSPLFLLPGTIFTALSWMVFSRLYRFYLQKLSPGKLTGGLSDAAVTLLWLYFCIELLFLGAMLCRLVQTEKNPQEH